MDTQAVNTANTGSPGPMISVLALIVSIKVDLYHGICEEDVHLSAPRADAEQV